MRKQIQPVQMHPYYGEVYIRSKGIRKLFYKLLPIPLHTFYPLRYEIPLTILRFLSSRTPRRYRAKRDLVVNVGAGDKGKPGWVNIDVVKAPGINCLYDCRKKLPFPDDSVKGIFSEHFFEHLDYTEEVPCFLSECHRVLRPGGVLRLIVPDLQKYLRAYCEEGWDTLVKIRPLQDGKTDRWFKCRYRTKMELLNVLFRQGCEHKYAYDYKTLEFLLHRYGFSYVQQQKFGESLMEELCIDWAVRASESLYVEAMK